MSKWTKDWPKEQGRYWFYGWPYGNTEELITHKPVKPELSMVNVWKVNNGVAWVREGNFWAKSEGGIGLFCKAELPDIPDVSGMIPSKNKAGNTKTERVKS